METNNSGWNAFCDQLFESFAEVLAIGTGNDYTTQDTLIMATLDVGDHVWIDIGICLLYTSRCV